MVEDGDSFHANARKKAVEISEMVEGDVLARTPDCAWKRLIWRLGYIRPVFPGEGATDEKE